MPGEWSPASSVVAKSSKKDSSRSKKDAAQSGNADGSSSGTTGGDNSGAAGGNSGNADGSAYGASNTSSSANSYGGQQGNAYGSSGNASGVDPAGAYGSDSGSAYNSTSGNAYGASSGNPSDFGSGNTPGRAKTQFKLNAERRHMFDGDDTNPAPTSLRIQRDKVDLNANVNANGAPNYSLRDGAKLVPDNGFNLNAKDFALQGKANANGNSSPLQGMTGQFAPIEKPLQGRVKDSGAPLTGQAAFAQELSKFDLDFIVDQSLSMRARDCPFGMSRWEWCGQQLNELSNQLTPFTPRGFNLTTFSGGFQTFDHANANQLKQLFANPNFTPGTRLSAPLESRLANYFNNRGANSKPRLIVVITDGIPFPKQTEPFVVAETIVDATHEMSNPNEVTVVIFQIGGGDRFGREFVNYMDTGLVADGAKYDIVRSMNFDQLAQIGLTRALVNSVSEFAQKQKTSSKPNR